jgi:tripartite-type tricarboxylate transporter receptor subunit TctC
MMMMKRPIVPLLLAFVGFVLLSGEGQSHAQTYPARGIRLVVPISPGSVTDVAARLMAQELGERLGTTAIVENKPGTNMVVGAIECARSAPDGYTLCVVSPDTMSYNPFMIPHLPYDPDKDFRPVTNMYNVIEGLLAKQTLATNSVADLRVLAASAPSLTLGTVGGGTADMYRLWLNDVWKTKIVGVPFRGGSDIIGALLAGNIDFTKIGMGNASGHLSEGKLKVLALRSSKRHELLPDVPTFQEAGLGGFPGGPIFWGVVVPRATPDPIVHRLNSEIVQILRGPKFSEFAKKQFLDVGASSVEQFAAFLKEDRQHAELLVKKYGGTN